MSQQIAVKSFVFAALRDTLKRDIHRLTKSSSASGEGIRVMKLSRCIRSAAALVAAAIALISAGPTSAAAVSWITNSNGFWTTPTNWSSNPSIPGPADNVNIDRPLITILVTIDSGTQSINSLNCNENLQMAAGSLSVAASSTINGSLLLNAGTLTGAGNISVGGAMTWGNADIGDTGTTSTITTSGGLTMNGTGTHDLLHHNLTNTATATWISGAIRTGSGAIITNASTATFDIQGDSTLSNAFGGAASTFSNAGILTKSTGSGTTTISLPFNNTGTVNANSGILSLSGGGTSTGRFNIASTLDFPSGTHNLNAGSTIAGAGTMSVSGATVNVAGAFTFLGTTELSSGTANFNAPTTFNGPLNISAGTITGGILGGSGNVIAKGLTMTLGTIKGAANFTTSGPFTINAPTFVRLEDRTFNSTGTAFWEAGDIRATNLSFTNTATGNFDIHADADFLQSFGASTFTNAGTLTKSGGTGATTFSLPFNNSGTVNANSGTLLLINGGDSSGHFNIASNLEFAGGIHNLNAGSSVGGTGTLTVSSGTLNVASAFSFSGTSAFSAGDANFNNATTFGGPVSISGGTVGGSGNINFKAPLTMTLGTIDGTGIVNVSAGWTINSPTFIRLNTPNLNNTSVAIWSAGQIRGDNLTFNNTTSGRFDIQADDVVSNSFGASIFNNAGTVNKIGGSGITTFSLPFNNSGTVNVNSGTLLLSGGGTHSGHFNSAATLTFGGGTHNLNAGSVVSGAGDVVVNAGTVVVGGSWNVGGTSDFVGGTINFNAPTTFNGPLNISAGTITGGILGGSGNVIARSLTMTLGTIKGIANFTTSGPFTINAPTFVRLEDRTFNSTGTALWEAGDIRATNLTFTNTATGNFDIHADADFLQSFGASTFTNAGTLTKSGGTGATTFSLPFNNSGTVNANSGTLLFGADGTQTGHFNVSANLEFSAGTVNFNAGSIVSGAGKVSFTGATANIAGSYSVAGLSELTAGDINFNTATTIPGAVNLAGASLRGAGNVTVNGPFNWSSGNIENNSTTLTTTGGLTINAPTFVTLTNHNLTNTGAAVWAAGRVRTGTSIINNVATAALEIQADAIFDSVFGASTFNNSGIITKSAGAGITNFSLSFNNTGAISSNSGTLLFSGALNWSGGSMAGTSLVSSTGALTISNTVNKDGSGILTISGPQSHASNALMKITGGELHLASNAGTPATAGAAAIARLALSMTQPAKIVMESDQTLRSLDLNAAASGVQSVDLDSPAGAGAFRSISVYTNDSIIARNALYAAIVHANVAGAVNSADGIFDSQLASHPNSKIGIAQLFDAHGDKFVLIRPTKLGDLNLDGQVSIADFIDLAAHFNAPGTWQEGDVNYDNSVTIADFIDLAANFNSSYSGASWPITMQEQRMLADFAAANVPEPGLSWLAALTSCGLLSRRRLRAG